jgi:protein TonB
MKNAKKKFLNRPEYPGGKEAFKAYVKSHLVYPEEAKQKRIEGVVQLLAQIDDNGNVGEVTVENGIGGGCDEEAVRLIKNVQFGSVKNRGVRLKTRKRFRIEFKLPQGRKKSVIR